MKKSCSLILPLSVKNDYERVHGIICSRRVNWPTWQALIHWGGSDGKCNLLMVAKAEACELRRSFFHYTSARLLAPSVCVVMHTRPYYINWAEIDLILYLEFVAITCPKTQQFTECASSCPPTCQIKNGNYICPQRCLDVCQCRNGTVYDGQRCVTIQQCPCLHNKKHYPPNSVIKRDCNNW